MMILFSAEAILASSTSKSGTGIPLTDDENLNSSTESTNSTEGGEQGDPFDAPALRCWTASCSCGHAGTIAS